MTTKPLIPVAWITVCDGDLFFARVSVGGFDQERRRGNEGPTPITSDKLFNYEFLQDSNVNATLSWMNGLAAIFCRNCSHWSTERISV